MAFTQINLENVSSVYKGKAGYCCCGCSGKYAYASQHREWASKNRGYDVPDDDINDKKVASIVKKMNALLASGEVAAEDIIQDAALTCIDLGTRRYIAYLKKN